MGNPGPSIYDLQGEAPFGQVEPAASYWARCPVLKSPNLTEIIKEVGSVDLYPNDPTSELATLVELIQHRNDPAFLAGDVRNPLSSFLTEAAFFKRPPPGAVLKSGAQRIDTGLELASLFEAETPGLWHHQVLHVLFDPTAPLFGGNAEVSPAALSPPRQALVWAALNVAISSALMAAWHFKWIQSDEEQVAYRQRPVEYDKSFDVLYDLTRNLDGNGFLTGRGPGKKPKPKPSPGTPRHPAYPSGHSTYSAAASEVLGCFFPDFKEDFRKLATNIGWARIWGGVHWETDHIFGQKVGEATGRLIIAQLNKTGIAAMSNSPLHPPLPENIANEAQAYGEKCEAHSSDFCKGIWRIQQQPQVQNLV